MKFHVTISADNELLDGCKIENLKVDRRTISFDAQTGQINKTPSDIQTEPCQVFECETTAQLCEFLGDLGGEYKEDVFTLYKDKLNPGYWVIEI